MEPAIIGGIAIFIVIIIIIIVIVVTTNQTKTPDTTIAPAVVSTPANTPAVVLTPANTAAVTVTKDYLGNNGTVSGARYCSGNWESSSGEKNMKCISGKNITSGAALNCNTVYGLGGSYSYTCSSDPVKYSNYNGNNGTVNGIDYCTGVYESTDSANKNLNCLYGKNNTTGDALDCNTVYGLGGPYTYTCGN